MKFFGPQLAIDFQLPQIAEERAFLRGEAIRFLLQRLKTLSRAACQRFGARAVGRLRRQASRQADHGQAKNPKGLWKGH
jgi:hypothetical protein